jgi:hypothetical protein
MSKRRKEGTRKSSTSKNADVKTKKNAPSLNMSKGNPKSQPLPVAWYSPVCRNAWYHIPYA